MMICSGARVCASRVGISNVLSSFGRFFVATMIEKVICACSSSLQQARNCSIPELRGAAIHQMRRPRLTVRMAADNGFQYLIQRFCRLVPDEPSDAFKARDTPVHILEARFIGLIVGDHPDR